MAYLRLSAICVVCVYLTACAMGGGGPSPDETTAPSKVVDLGKDNPKDAETDPEKRVTDALQAAKSAYDEQAYEAAHRYAETAENLVVEFLRSSLPDKLRRLDAGAASRINERTVHLLRFQGCGKMRDSWVFGATMQHGCTRQIV